MSLPQIRAVAEIDARFDPSPWPWADAHRDQVRRHWNELSAANPSLYNGQVLVARERRFDLDRLLVRYVAADYASFLTFRDLGFPDSGTGNCFGMAALRSADGAYLLGVMGQHTANAGRIYFPAGTPEPVDVGADGRVDILGNVLRELAEETGLHATEVEVGAGWTVVLEGGRTALMREIVSTLHADALVRRVRAFLASEQVPEFADLRLVRGPVEIDDPAVPSFVQAYLRHRLT